MLRKSLVTLVAASATIGAVALVLPARDASAQDSYEFKLTNGYLYTELGIRCGTSGSWTGVPGGSSANITCSGTTAQWRDPNHSQFGTPTSVTWDCEDSETDVISISPSGPMGIDTTVERNCET